MKQKKQYIPGLRRAYKRYNDDKLQTHVAGIQSQYIIGCAILAAREVYGDDTEKIGRLIETIQGKMVEYVDYPPDSMLEKSTEGLDIDWQIQ